MSDSSAGAQSPAAQMSAGAAMFIGIGAMVGAGIFALLGQAGSIAEGATWLSFLAAGGISLLLGYSFVKLGLRYPSRGGLIAYLAVGYGVRPITGGLALLTLLAGIITLAMAALTFGGYGAALVDASDPSPVLAKALAIAVVVLLTVVVGLGSSALNILQTVAVIVVLVVLGGISLLAAGSIDTANVGPTSFAPATSIIASLGLTFFVYTGFQIIANSVEDLSTPKRQLPIAMYGSIAITAALYVVVAFAIFGVLGSDKVVEDADTAIAVAAKEVAGQAGVVGAVVAAGFATVSTILANLYFGLNTTYSLATAGALPSRYARTAWKNATRGLTLTSLIAVVLIAFLNVTQIASAGSIIYLVVFIMINVAHYRLRSETGASGAVLLLGTMLLLVAAVPFVISTWENERLVIWFTIGSLIAATLLEAYLFRVRKVRVPVPASATGSEK